MHLYLIPTFLSLLALIPLLNLTSCSDTTAPPSSISTTSSLQEFSGRNSPLPIYRAKVPTSWIRLNTDLSSLNDTTKPLCEFQIHDPQSMSSLSSPLPSPIIITIHNFPSTKMEERIPPKAQISRWKRQFDSLNLPSITTTPQAFGGFSGYLFEAQGTLHGKPLTMMAWSMQLDPELYRQLSRKDTPENLQKKADYTIKIIGPQELITQHRDSLIAFARSFELIQPIPLSR